MTGTAPWAAFRRLAHWARRPLLAAFNVTPEGRATLVERMVARQVHEAPMYWLQLVLAMAIATLGLALGSSVVVIGAMLISPLMTPIVDLGMGLAVGLPSLVGGSFARVVGSVAVVVGAAALITTTLPFHEITPPIAARAAPTELHLLIAACCALMASFATVAGSMVATTAAGTALAIALVPPLCVVGIGLGTHQLALARGAALLFVADFSAIMLFAVLTFTAFGFGEVAPTQRWTRGAALRVLMPLLLLGLVYAPLRRALVEVAWEVRTRQAIRRDLDALPKRVVQLDIDVSGHAVHLRLVIVGEPHDAQVVEKVLRERITAAAGVRPNVSVVAVPDAEAVRHAMDIAEMPKVEVFREPDWSATRASLGDALSKVWPVDSVGPLVGWRMEAGARGSAVVRVVHVGAGLGATAVDLLGRELTQTVGEPVAVQDDALTREPISAPADRGALWLIEITPMLDDVTRFDPLHACLQVPDVPPTTDGGEGHGAAGASSLGAVRAATILAASRVPDGRAVVMPGASWSLSLETGPCPEPNAGPTDGGTTDDTQAKPSPDSGEMMARAAATSARGGPRDASAPPPIDAGMTHAFRPNPKVIPVNR